MAQTPRYQDVRSTATRPSGYFQVFPRRSRLVVGKRSVRTVNLVGALEGAFTLTRISVPCGAASESGRHARSNDRRVSTGIENATKVGRFEQID
jgi:hypothetical protein